MQLHHFHFVPRTLALSTLLIALTGLSAHADSDFQARRMTRNDVPLGKGQCDIRLRVDGEVEVSVQLDRVHVRTVSGRDAVDAGSECNEPLPARLLNGFNFEKMDGRGEMQLLSPPERQSGFRAVVRIRDSEGGDGRYHFRLSWQLDGGGPGRPGVGGPGAGYGDGRGDGYGRDRDRDYNDRPGYGRPDRNRPGRMEIGEAVRICTEAVRDRIDRDYRYRNAEIRNARLDNRAGRNDSIIGDAIGRRGNNVEEFIFNCSVNFDNGNVRSVDVRRR
jgi:hypothetical protein